MRSTHLEIRRTGGSQAPPEEGRVTVLRSRVCPDDNALTWRRLGDLQCDEARQGSGAASRRRTEWHRHPGLGPSQIRNQLRRKNIKVSVNTARA